MGIRATIYRKALGLIVGGKDNGPMARWRTGRRVRSFDEYMLCGCRQ